MNIFRKPLFLAGLLTLSVMFLGSFVYSWIVPESEKPIVTALYEKGVMIKSAPLPPHDNAVFGTDRFGVTMWHKTADGAKYTIGLALFLAGGRMIIGIVIGMALSFLPGKMLLIMKKAFEAFFYAPSTLIVYMVAYPALIVFTWAITKNEQLFAALAVIILVAIPPVAINTANEISHALRFEFITSVKTLGGSRLYILRRHILPFLWPKFAIFFGQQTVAVLLLLAHLGVLKVFIGGIDYVTLEPMDNQVLPVAMMNEWASMIGSSFQNFRTYPWLILTPLTGFALAIVAVNLMVEAAKEHYLDKGRSSGTNRRKKQKTLNEDTISPDSVSPFHRLKKTGTE
ncbi:hypothetical protein ACFQPF_07380 [Fictibacillus iocasae]|uniref:ABC transmembrane type-1 domain-containing protein n=1 Tax=Fictibacillus iocasae TaxID=2715437 RepID=A0ABW2NQS2_9BACL